MIRVSLPKGNKNASSDVDGLISQVPSLKPFKKEILNSTLDYPRKYRQCPAKKSRSLATLKGKYKGNRKKIIDLFFNGEVSGCCVYCGMLQSTTLDHFHPKTKAPQYTFTRMNLFRSCSSCNSKKGSKFPISKLGLEHPALSRLFKGKNTLFFARLYSLGFDDYNDLICEVKILPNESLNASSKKRIAAAIHELGINNSLVDRIEEILRAEFGALRSSANTFDYLSKRFHDSFKSAKIKNDIAEIFAFQFLKRKSTIKKLFLSR